MVSFLIVLVATVPIFSALMVFGPGGSRGMAIPGLGTSTRIAFAMLAMLAIDSIIWLGFAITNILIQHGIMVVELTACIVLLLVFSILTGSSFALLRKRWTAVPLFMLSIAALPISILGSVALIGQMGR